MTRAENERRIIRPIVGGPGTPTQIQGIDGKVPPRAVRRSTDALDWVAETASLLDRRDLRAQWHATAIATEQHRRAYERVDFSQYRCVLVPRQSHPFVRALIQAARNQGVPVAYIPHSPLTLRQVDLPVTHAGLRGEAERALIAATTGADAARIDVVGNPSIDILTAEPPQISASQAGVLALGPDPERRLADVIELLTSAGLQDILVAPHPRTDARTLRRSIPRGWSVHTGARTLDLLRQGPPWVIQRNSGAAWESAALGIPTANIKLSDDPPVYPFLDTPRVTAVSSPDEVRSFVANASNVDRGALRRQMREWCTYDGEDSIERARRFLDRASNDRTCTTPIADVWARGGTLWARSPLTAQQPIER